MMYNGTFSNEVQIRIQPWKLYHGAYIGNQTMTQRKQLKIIIQTYSYTY